VLNNIFVWLAERNWKNWDMWAAFGQIIGAIATVWAVTVALKQTKIGLKQTQLAIEQMEEARKKEEEARVRDKEALKPELTIQVNSEEEEDTKLISILLTNTKQLPVIIHKFKLFHYGTKKDKILENTSHQIKSDNINTKIPETVTFRDVCITKIPINILLEEIKKERISCGFFECLFFLTTGEVLTVSILLDYTSEESLLNLKVWYLYACPKRLSVLSEMRNKDYFKYFYDSGIFPYTPATK
jgi:hypothetical protein